MQYICLYQNGAANFAKLIEQCNQKGYSAVMVPINSNMAPHFLTPDEDDPVYPDLVLNANQWSMNLIPILGENLDVDSPNEKLRSQSVKALERDITWADHLQYNGFSVINLQRKHSPNLAKMVSKRTKGAFLIRIPIINPTVLASKYRSDVDENQANQATETDTWHWWQELCSNCSINSKVRVLLEFNSSLRPDQNIILRWIGEPIEAVMLHSSLFLRNRHNYPVLPREWQKIIGAFIAAQANIVISADITDSSLKHYADYMQKMMKDHASTGHIRQVEDYLEIPLQPLHDNLDCYTYEIFESDPVKYKRYQEAIEQALLDRVPEKEAKERLTVIMVLGAGRGPLVRAVFNAAEVTKRKVRVYIIEKNPNAIRTLKNLVKDMWSDRDIYIFSKDMRNFAPPELADIFVSELLGSFGDNELSPECLDGALRILQPDGISIPYKSTSYINPVMTRKVYTKMCESVVNRADLRTIDEENVRITPHDSGYVVLLKSVYNIAVPQPLFTFLHPNRNNEINNERVGTLKFTAQQDCVLHGFGGYFEAQLYGNVSISINPLTLTKGMFSWFPMFFPLENPCFIRANDTIMVTFWRCVTEKSVWYEWRLNAPTSSRLHNPNGIGYIIYR